MKPIYHITSAAEAKGAIASGEYAPQAFAREGFIHCSHRHQVCPVANRLFKGRTDLVLLEIDRLKLTCAIVEENLEGGAELFPHIYGRLPLSAIAQIHEFPCDTNGLFELGALGHSRRHRRRS